MIIKLKKPVNRIWKIIWIIDVLFLVTCLVISFFTGEITERLYSEQAAKRWQAGDMRFAQVSAFLSPEKKVDIKEIANIRASIMKKLKEDGYADANKSGKPLCDAYYSESDKSIIAGDNSADVTLSLVGGDFFTIHPFPLKKGNYFTEEDLNLDRIVLDENAAWNLFGSSEIEGLQVDIDGHLFTVAGVIKVPKDKTEKEAYGIKARAFIPFGRLKDEGTYISCYEAVLPNPIKSYAFNALGVAFGTSEERGKADETGVIRISNTERFDFFNLIEDLGAFKYMAMRKQAVSYPFWENEAIVKEYRIARWLLFRLFLLGFIVITIIVRITVWWIKREKTTFELVMEKIEDIKDKRNIRNQEKKEKEKTTG